MRRCHLIICPTLKTLTVSPWEGMTSSKATFKNIIKATGHPYHLKDKKRDRLFARNSIADRIYEPPIISEMLDV